MANALFEIGQVCLITIGFIASLSATVYVIWKGTEDA